MRKLSVPVFIIVLISLLLDFYVFQGLKALCHPYSGEFRLVIFYLFWFGSLAVLAAFVTNFYRAIPTGKFTLLFNAVFNVFSALFVSKLAFALVLLGEDVYRVFAGLIGEYPLRSDSFGRAGLLFASIPFLSFIFGVTRGKYHYKVRKARIYLEDLPKSFDGFTITQISDIHAGSLDSIKGVQRGIALINAQRSDLFVFTGDLVNNQASEIEPWIDVFAKIEATHGKFSVLGNHDYGDYIRWDSAEEKRRNLEQLKANHEKLGFRLLLDQHVKIEKGGESIALLGVENWGLGFGQRGDLEKALNGLDDKTVKVLLSHDPSHWDAMVKNHSGNIHVTLSGHTHGMQFGIEMFGFKWSPVKYRYPNWAGLARAHGRYLYVNRGFGFLGFSGRVGIWPEVTVIELHTLAQY
ncbi:metallophosphoesterase [Paradesertivirga mongoliensis]|uniref:Metallophosphoesterase n=1 Tax=Paradesertivirga mongoliensis TaxID=2100740 RepID=A0ABW4ZPI7_9SPHI|nr:metallophosphoesterase [Pedobacter mongoliensis]